ARADATCGCAAALPAPARVRPAVAPATPRAVAIPVAVTRMIALCAIHLDACRLRSTLPVPLELPEAAPTPTGSALDRCRLRGSRCVAAPSQPVNPPGSGRVCAGRRGLRGGRGRRRHGDTGLAPDQNLVGEHRVMPRVVLAAFRTAGLVD